MISDVDTIPNEIIERIKDVTFFTKRLCRNQLMGQSKSYVRGMGFDFDSLRDYTIGDDIRFIDWRGSSRSSNLLVRQFKQDQIKTVLLVVDISKSLSFGTINQKMDTVNRIAAIIGLIAQFSQDLIGLILFSDSVDLYLPPRRDKNYINVIMKALFSWKPKGTTTNSKDVLKYLLKATLKNTIVFWFSDCIDNQFEETIKLVSPAHDVYVMRCLDRLERQLPLVGSLLIQDLETEQIGYVNITPQHTTQLQKRVLLQEQIIKKNGVKTIDIIDIPNALEKIISLFRARVRM